MTPDPITTLRAAAREAADILHDSFGHGAKIVNRAARDARVVLERALEETERGEDEETPQPDPP